MDKRVVITGIGVISPNGIGKDAYWKALKKGISGIRPITLFDPGFFKSKQAGEITDFKPEQFLGEKGHRNLDRSAKLVCSAAKLALDDAHLNVTEENTDDIGVVTGTTLSVVWNIAQFGKEVLTEGLQSVNPAAFPGTTVNSASSQISIWYKIKGFNTTISTGYTAGLDALKYAIDFIQFGRAKAVLVAGVEGLSFANFTGFYKIGFLAGIKGEEVSCPFDRRRNGIVLGEGACVLIVEDEEFARARGAEIYAEVLSVANIFDSYRPGKYDPNASALKRSMYKALHQAAAHEDNIDYIASAANSVWQQDRLENDVIKEVFNIYAKDMPVSAVKSMVGESISASGLFQIAAAAASIKESFIPPTINYREKDEACDLDYVANEARDEKVDTVLVNNFGPGGNNATAVIGKYT